MKYHDYNRYLLVTYKRSPLFFSGYILQNIRLEYTRSSFSTKSNLLTKSHSPKSG